MEWRNLPSLNVGLLNILKVLLEKAMAIHSSTLAWKIPWMEGGEHNRTGMIFSSNSLPERTAL